MKKRLQLLVLVLVFLATIMALSACGYRPIQEYVPTEPLTYEVAFVDLDGTILKTERVAPGEAATAPRLPHHDGYVFTGWDVDFSQIDRPTTVTAQYVREWTVQFVDFNGNEVISFTVIDGEAAPTPVTPYRENFTFIGWDQDFSAVKSDMVIKATYVEDPKYTVEFWGFNGELLSTQKVYQGKDAMVPTPPAILHYTFKGWDQNTQNVTGNMTVNAIYEENAKFTVAFLDNLGNLLKQEVVYIGEGATAPEAPAVDNYTFAGWDKAFDNVQENLTVSATYTENAKFNVVFVDFDGTVLSTQVVYIGKNASAPADPSRENYDFAGWDKAFTNIQGDLTVQALYNEHAKYTVTFVDFDGNVLKSEVVYVGKDATAPADPSRENYDFAGWNKAFTNVQGDLTVQALYNEHAKFTVTFLGKDGQVLKSEVVYIGKDATAPSAPAVENFDFAGWDKAFANIQGDLTVQALYSEHAKFTVTFVDKDGQVLKSEVVYVGKNATAPEAPAVENHDFAGWDKAFTNIQGDITVTATYTEHAKYTVTFVGKDGQVLKSEVVYAGKSATAPEAPAVEGFTFLGWDKAFDNVQGDLTIQANYRDETKFVVTFVDKDGKVLKTEEVRIGEAATAPEAPLVDNYTFAGWDKAFTNVQGNLTVTATYTENAKYTVTFVGKDGQVLKSEVVYVGKNATAPEAPAVDGYTFSGWDVAFDNVQGDLTVKAVYTVKKYTVTFLGQGGAVLKTEEVEHGKAATAPEAPVVNGYDFKGWDVTFEAVTDNLTVTAIYEAQKPPVPTKLDNYKVMSWTLGGNAIYLTGTYGKFDPSFEKAVQEADPDIIILNGMGASSYTDPNFAVEGYSRWAYGEFADFRYTGVGYAILYKTDKFTPAGDVSYQNDSSYNGRNLKSFVMFPLKDTEGNFIPVVTAFLGTNHTEAHREQLFSDIKAALGNDLAAAIIRIYVESTTERNEFISGEVFSFTADENGYSFKSFGGVDIKKDGEHTTGATNSFYYSCFLTYSKGEATVTDINVVGITEDVTAFPNKQSNNAGFYTKAFTCIYGIPVPDTSEPAPEKHTVTFLGMDGTVIDTQEVEHGQAATAPEAPVVSGYTFAGWNASFDNVTSDITVTAVYTINKYTVTFLGMDDALIGTVEVEHGQGATAPEAPAVEGYVFKGWDVEFVAVTDNLTVRAIYEAVGGGDAGEDEEYEGIAIRTQEDLADLANASEGVYTIINDLALVEWAPISLPAGVVLGGNGHKITGLTTALFSEVHGTVKNLKIVDANIVGSTNAHKYGVVANKLFDGAVVSHVDVVNVNLVAYYAGGIAAEAEGNILIEHSTVSGTIKQASTSGSALVGGFIGRYLQSGTVAACRIEHSTNNADVTVSSNSASVAGFIANYGQGVKGNEMYFSYCTNNGEITITGKSGNAGGIFGYGYRCGYVYMDHCVNNADISNAQNIAGGLLSGLESGTSGAPAGAEITNCVNNGNISGATKIGGIVGNAGNTGSPSHKISNCVNNGNITGSGNDIGGIAGYSQQNNRSIYITGCSNYGHVQGKNYVGGIMGTFEGVSATPKFEVNANYGNVTATDGAAGGLLGKVNTATNYTFTVNGFLQTGIVKGKHASALIGTAYAQQYVDVYSGKGSYTIIGQLYKETCSVTTINATACVLSGDVIGSELAGVLIGSFYGDVAPIFNLKDVLCDIEVTEQGELNSNPAAYYQFLYVVTAGDADLVGTENEGKTMYYGRAAADPSYIVACKLDTNAIAHALTYGEIAGDINTSVSTEGSAAYILHQAALKLGYNAWWKNGETYPVITNVKYTVTFVDKNGEILFIEDVIDGHRANAPEIPVVDGFTIVGWSDAFAKVESHLTVKAIYTVDFDAASVTLQDNLLVNFKVNADKLAGKELLKAIVTFGGKTFEIPVGEIVDGKYVFSVPVAPHQMNDQITIQLCFAGEWNGTVTHYSIATYCYNKLETAEGEFKALLTGILNYGAAAQVAVGHNVGNLANAGLSPDEKTVVYGDITASSTQTEASEDHSALWTAAGLLLNDKIVIRFAFEAENVEGLTVLVSFNGQNYTVDQFTPAGAGRFYVYIEGLNAAQLRDQVSVTLMRGQEVVSATLTYSVEVYATKVLAYDGVEGYENLVALVKAMMAYGDAAYAYVN